jgi:hypothetical protein
MTRLVRWVLRIVAVLLLAGAFVGGMYSWDLRRVEQDGSLWRLKSRANTEVIFTERPNVWGVATISLGLLVGAVAVWMLQRHLGKTTA